MCNILQNNNLSQNQDTLTVDKSFKMAKLEYAKNFITKSPIIVYDIHLKSTYNGSLMFYNCMTHMNLSDFDISPLEYEYGEDEREHDIYSPGVCIKYYNKDVDIIFVFIISLNGEAHLFTNDSFYGYHMMVDLIFGGERNFTSSCKIKSMRVNANQGEIIPFFNMLDEWGRVNGDIPLHIE